MVEQNVVTVPIQIMSSKDEFESYIDDCLLSLESQDGLGEHFALRIVIGLYQTVTKTARQEVLARSKENLSIEIVDISMECGYGEKQNFLWQNHTFRTQRNAECFLMLNPDMILLPDVVSQMLAAYDANRGKAFIIEARQFPVENPARAFDPQTGEVDWASGACILVSANFFNNCGGFDENIFLYCEDVDLSWMAWLAGGKVIYCPDARVAHMTNGIFKARYTLPVSVATHEKYTLLSHLILVQKYFSRDPGLLEQKMKLFWDHPGSTEKMKGEAYREFARIKDELACTSESHPRINIIDVGLYSEMRP